MFFINNLIFSEFLESWNTINLTLTLALLYFITYVLIFEIRSTRFSLGFIGGNEAKPCELNHVHVVCNCFSLATVWRTATFYDVALFEHVCRCRNHAAEKCAKCKVLSIY